MSVRKSSSWRHRMFSLVMKRDGEACAKCGDKHRLTCSPGGVYVTSLEEGHRYSLVIWRSILELDHRLPLHLGGDNEPDNLWLLCAVCHRSKTSAEQSARLKALGAGRNPR